MNCEKIRLTVKRVLGLLVLLPITLAITPLWLVVIPIIALFDTDSCDEFNRELMRLGAEHINDVKNLLLGRAE